MKKAFDRGAGSWDRGHRESGSGVRRRWGRDRGRVTRTGNGDGRDREAGMTDMMDDCLPGGHLIVKAKPRNVV